MSREYFSEPTNPYHYVLHCISGRWKMTILHEIHTFGKIHFNRTLRVLPISVKMLSQQLKELADDGLIERVVDSSAYPPSVEYTLTKAGREIIPALDKLYVWGVRQMAEKEIPIDQDAFAVHQDERYYNALHDLINEKELWNAWGRDPSSREKK